MHSEAGDVCPCGLHSTGARLHWAEEGPEDVQSNGTTACLWKRGQEVKVTGPRLGGKNGGCREKMEGSAMEGPAKAGHPLLKEQERAGSEGESAQRGARTPKAVVWMMGMKRTGGDSGRTHGPTELLSQCRWQPGGRAGNGQSPGRGCRWRQREEASSLEGKTVEPPGNHRQRERKGGKEGLRGPGLWDEGRTQWGRRSGVGERNGVGGQRC